MYISLRIILLYFFFSSGIILKSKVAEVTVKIHERRLLPCSESSDLENVEHIGWFRCSTADCELNWNKLRIAHVQNVEETIADNPDFDVFTNGTLLIRKVLPVDDGKMFICKTQKTFEGVGGSTTILNIKKEPPKLIPESPLEVHVIEGMDLHMDAGVQGYPYPWVSWSHNDLLLQNTSNVDSQTSLKIRNVTVSKGGLYTCYAKNSVGHHILTFKVYVEGQAVRTTTGLDIQTPSSSPTSALDIQTLSSSTTSGGSSFAGWKIALTAVGLLLFLMGTIGIFCILKKKRIPAKLQLCRLCRRRRYIV